MQTNKKEIEEHVCYDHLIEVEHPYYICSICGKDVVLKGYGKG